MCEGFWFLWHDGFLGDGILKKKNHHPPLYDVQMYNFTNQTTLVSQWPVTVTVKIKAVLCCVHESAHISCTEHAHMKRTYTSMSLNNWLIDSLIALSPDNHNDYLRTDHWTNNKHKSFHQQKTKKHSELLKQIQNTNSQMINSLKQMRKTNKETKLTNQMYQA